MRIAALGGLIAIGSILAACSTVNPSPGEGKIDYKSSQTLPPLEVPPDLNQVSTTGGTSVPGIRPGDGGPKTYSAYEQVQAVPPAGQVATRSQVLPTAENARIERAGTQRWLVVKGDPDQLWSPIRNFFLSTGLVMTVDNPTTGIMETDWAENYANIGTAWQKFQRKYLGGLFSTGTRDKFRIRMERGSEPGTTEIYVSHRAMVEVVASSTAEGIKEYTWQPAPSDPNLESEMLRLLMVHLGAPEEVATKVAAEAKKTKERAVLVAAGGAPAKLMMDEDFNRAWQRVGLSLDRIGFTVEDRDRSNGVYYVRFVDDAKAAKKKGFFGRIFSTNSQTRSEQYQVKVASEGTQSVVIVNDKDGTPDKSETGKKILTLLHEQLK